MDEFFSLFPFEGKERKEGKSEEEEEEESRWSQNLSFPGHLGDRGLKGTHCLASLARPNMASSHLADYKKREKRRRKSREEMCFCRA